MDDVMDKLLSGFGMEMCAKKEAALRAALPDNLVLLDVKNRLKCVVSTDGIETYMLDGEPLIQFMPTEYKMKYETNSVRMVATQQTRTF